MWPPVEKTGEGVVSAVVASFGMVKTIFIRGILIGMQIPSK